MWCTMKIFIGSDHKGFALKKALLDHFNALQSKNPHALEADKNALLIDCGCTSSERTDYPIHAARVCENVRQDVATHRGILICDSGIGMSIAANRFKLIYAALCWDEAIARSARADDNANILVLPASQVDTQTAIKLVTIFLETPFKEGAYAQRLEMIDKKS